MNRREVQIYPMVRLRWLTVSCFELRVGDYAIVIDPFLSAAPNAPFGAEVVQQADLILLSHGHWDHTSDLKTLQETFDCPVLCGELTAPSLIRMLNANPARVYPMTPDLELDFGAVKVKALFARHTDQHRTNADLMAGLACNPLCRGEDSLTCNFFGNLEYRNWLITTPDGLKILFWGSNVTAEQLRIVSREQPDLAMLQYTKQKPENLARLVQAGGIKMIWTHHMDLTQKEEEYLPRMAALEACVHACCPACIVMRPERLRWYSVGLQAAAE